MTQRASIFGSDDDLDVADFKPAAAPRPRDPDTVAAVRQTAESRGFVSREASPAASPWPVVAAPAQAASIDAIPQEARLRRRRTGRDRQLNIKVTEDCLAQFYAVADANQWGLGETFERALAALEIELKGSSR